MPSSCKYSYKTKDLRRGLPGCGPHEHPQHDHYNNSIDFRAYCQTQYFSYIQNIWSNIAFGLILFTFTRFSLLFTALHCFTGLFFYSSAPFFYISSVLSLFYNDRNHILHIIKRGLMYFVDGCGALLILLAKFLILFSCRNQLPNDFVVFVIFIDIAIFR